ncbi:hypothetical protein [Streptomyces youssoufiensis]
MSTFSYDPDDAPRDASPGDHDALLPVGEQVAEREATFWELRREVMDLDDDDGSRRARRRLSRQSRRANLEVRIHRATRRTLPPPLDRDLVLPPLDHGEDREGRLDYGDVYEE